MWFEFEYFLAEKSQQKDVEFSTIEADLANLEERNVPLNSTSFE